MKTSFHPRALGLTADSVDGPVPPDVRGPVGQLEGKGPRVGVQVPVQRRDVDGVRLGLLAHLRLLREHLGSVVVDIQKVDLQSTCAARLRLTCDGRGETNTHTHTLSTYIFIKGGGGITTIRMQLLICAVIMQSTEKVKYGVYASGLVL